MLPPATAQLKTRRVANGSRERNPAGLFALRKVCRAPTDKDAASVTQEGKPRQEPRVTREQDTQKMGENFTAVREPDPPFTARGHGDSPDLRV